MDFERIEKAVKRMESTTSGEIVVSIEEISDDYTEVRWKLALVFGAAASALLGLLSWFGMLPYEWTIWVGMLMVLGLSLTGLIIGMYLVKPFLSLISDNVLADKTERRSLEIFLREEIFNTRDRVGILLHVSRCEHKANILADTGIFKKVPEEKWQEIVNEVGKQSKKGRLEEGVVAAIESCEQLLLDHGFKNTGSDKNELSDNIRTGEES